MNTSNAEISNGVRLASLFTDHAVLQRDISIPVWGWTSPNTDVLISCGAQNVKTKSKSDGYFVGRLSPMGAGGPYTLTVSAGQEQTTAHDIWIGEVWLAAGQSNMFMPFSVKEEALIKEFSQTDCFRLLKVPEQADPVGQRDANAVWRIPTSENLEDFSKVASHFAKIIGEETNLKIGILSTAFGETIVQSWTSRETLIRNPLMRHKVERYEETLYSTTAEFKEENVDFPTDPGNQREEWAAPDYDDSLWKNMCLPATWTSYEHFTNGVFWYRKKIEVPKDWEGNDLTLSLGRVFRHDITYFNGEKVGENEPWTPQSHACLNLREYKIPARLVKSGENVIAVRVCCFLYEGGFVGPRDQMRLFPSNDESKSIPLKGYWKYAVEYDSGPVVTPPSIGEKNQPYRMFDNMLAPLIPYAIRGAIWYQGESDGWTGEVYHRLLVDMIRDWRFKWGQGDFPFYIVQIPNVGGFGSIPLIREAQLKALSEPNTGLAVTIDVGDDMDAHPINKRPVGYRLAQWALRNVYNKQIIPSGPLYRSATIEGNRIRISFDYVGGGLVAKEGDLRTFEVVGNSGDFVAAKALVDGDTVVVSSSECEKPIAVRYAWANCPDTPNLYNSDGLPASPFRSYSR